MKKWMMWSMLLPTYFLAFVHRTALSSLGDELAVAFCLDEAIGTTLGFLAGVYFLVYAVMQLPGGILADSLGPRKTVAFSSFCMGIATIWFAYSSTMISASAARFLIGFGGAFNFIALLRMQVNWFEHRYFPLLTSLTVVIGNLGGFFGVGPFAGLVQILGWRQAYAILGWVALFFSPLILLIVRDTPVDKLTSNDKGFEVIPALKRAFCNRVNVHMFFGFGCAAGVYQAIAGFWGIPFLNHVYGIAGIEASGTLSLMSLGVVFGALFLPLTLRVYDNKKIICAVMLTCACVVWSALVYTNVQGTILLKILFFLFGLLVSSFTLTFSIVRQNNSDTISGTALSLVNTSAYAVVALLQPLLGAILDSSGVHRNSGVPVYSHHSYKIAFSVTIFLMLVSAVAVKTTKEKSVAGLQPGN